MASHLKILVLLFTPLMLWSQEPASDTIKQDASFLKIASDAIYETTIDTAITISINEILAKNSDFNFDNEGDDDDWFEIYNYGDEPIRVNDLWFSDDPNVPFKWKTDTASAIYLYPGQFMLFWADSEPEEGHLHCTFKLSGDGEYLSIRYKDSTLVDELKYGKQSTNISFGRYPDGGTTWQFFTKPSPRHMNNSSGGSMLLPLPTASHRGGIYKDPFILKLGSLVPGCRIRYTLDSKDPGSKSAIYKDPLIIMKTTIVRAQLIKEGMIDGPVLNLSFLFDDNAYHNPVVSLVSDPMNFYGVYGLISANNSSVEIPANFEYIVKGQSVFSSGAGIQLHSAKSIKPNSLRLYARSRYGNDWFNYSFFDNEAPEVHKRLILRNSGNDNVNKNVNNSHMRDPLAVEIINNSNDHPLYSASRPVNVFLNGTYYGLFNLRERIDEFYIQTHTGESEDFDLLERAFGYGKNRHAITGSFEAWDDLLSFVDTTGNLRLETDYQDLNKMVDIENFTEYWITEVFTGNYDWLSNNVKFWKPEKGKWQWLYWDMDHALGLDYRYFGEPDWNTLQWSLTFSDRAWPNGFNNILIRNLIKNEEYKAYFIKKFTTKLNTSFSYEETRKLYDKLRLNYIYDMPVHAKKWENDYQQWVKAADTIDYYLKTRPTEQFKHLQEFFGLDAPVKVSVEVLPPGAGLFMLDGEKLSSDTLTGKFFPGMNYNISYDPIPGFKFLGMSLNEEQTNSSSFLLSEDTDIKISFISNGAFAPLILSEAYFNNKEEYDSGDWLEFYYYGFDTLNLSGCKIFGPNQEVLYNFAEGQKVPPLTYFVVTEDQARFKNIFTDTLLCFGNFNSAFPAELYFSLESGSFPLYKSIELMGNQDWPKLPSRGYSIELKNLASEARLGNNWGISSDHYGSPGLPANHFYNFEKPQGKDSVVSNQESITIHLSSPDFYYDEDEHKLASIYITDIQGPGSFSTAHKIVVGNSYYEPGDILFVPKKPKDFTTELRYRFIDQSGQQSNEYTIYFSKFNAIKDVPESEFKIYPSPARDELYIELGKPDVGQLDFLLYNISGRAVMNNRISPSTNRIKINLSDLVSGMYFYEVRTKAEVYKGKVEVVR